MPTGYTARLEEMKYDVRRWIKESAVRAMGICVMLRDDGDKTQTEIEDRLKKSADSDNYYRKSAAEKAARLDTLNKFTPSEWQNEYAATRTKAQADYDKRLKEQNHKKELHIKSLNEAEKLLSVAREQRKSDAVTGTLSFAVSQLRESLSFDYGHPPYKESVLSQTLDQFTAATLNETARDADRHAEEAKKEAARQTDRLGAYRELTEFVDEYGPSLEEPK